MDCDMHKMVMERLKRPTSIWWHQRPSLPLVNDLSRETLRSKMMVEHLRHPTAIWQKQRTLAVGVPWHNRRNSLERVDQQLRVGRCDISDGTSPISIPAVLVVIAFSCYQYPTCIHEGYHSLKNSMLGIPNMSTCMVHQVWLSMVCSGWDLLCEHPFIKMLNSGRRSPFGPLLTLRQPGTWGPALHLVRRGEKLATSELEVVFL